MYLNTFTCLHSNLISSLLETRFLFGDFLNMLLQPFERPLREVRGLGGPFWPRGTLLMLVQTRGRLFWWRCYISQLLPNISAAQLKLNRSLLKKWK